MLNEKLFKERIGIVVPALMLSAVALSVSSCGGGAGLSSTQTPVSQSGVSRSPSINISANSVASSIVASVPKPIVRSVLVQLVPGHAIEKVASDNISTLVESDAEDRWYRLSIPGLQSEDQFIQKLSKDPRIVAVEKYQPLTIPEAGGGSVDGNPIHLAFDRTLSTTTRYLSITSGDAINEAVYRQTNLADALSVTKGAGITVAVLDTGVMATHPNLADNLVPGYNALDSKLSTDDVADGTINTAWGHGTMVAGVIARLAPEAKIMPVRVLDADGNGSVLAVAKGIRYAMQNGARVINLSLGGTRKYGVLTQVLRIATDAGVVVVAASGNDGTSIPQYPAGITNVIGVAAADAIDQKAVFSTYGSDVSLVAPGVGIRSTYVNGGYATWSGTSFAAPFVSAAAALTLSAQPSLTGDAVRQRLLLTGRSIDAQNPAYVGQLGHGMLDIARSVRVDPTNP